MDSIELARTAIDHHGANQDPWEFSATIGIAYAWPHRQLAVEIGCDRGGTLWAWKQLYARVIGVTLHTRDDGVFISHGAAVIEGDSRSETTRAALRELIGGDEVGLVFIDGNHRVEYVNADLELARQIAPRGLIVLHDIAGYHYQGDDCEVDLVWSLATASGPYIEIVAQEGKTPGTGILFPAPPK